MYKNKNNHMQSCTDQEDIVIAKAHGRNVYSASSCLI